MSDETRHGHCLCGAVNFTVHGPVSGASICHCGQCRRQSGHLWASALAPRAAIDIRGNVQWYAASEIATRGFCPRCGSFLFWNESGSEMLSFSLGALDAPTDLRIEKHIFCDDKGDYYEIGEDGVPRSP
ncbi:GFA family protein [Tropicimonas sp. IMCC6043]|uniref:GFA family protein n=1 Tax=Tropicimonas sp. IMCC6043 TaxID=2510645 RepID=UPI00101D4BAD|nr:GFA family protein [Tropicimonas sp. IMCC6043]RYH09068.1 GFA family protein [Tropicimonas sp. IMCC6043]